MEYRYTNKDQLHYDLYWCYMLCVHCGFGHWRIPLHMTGLLGEPHSWTRSEAYSIPVIALAVQLWLTWLEPWKGGSANEEAALWGPRRQDGFNRRQLEYIAWNLHFYTTLLVYVLK